MSFKRVQSPVFVQSFFLTLAMTSGISFFTGAGSEWAIASDTPPPPPIVQDSGQDSGQDSSPNTSNVPPCPPIISPDTLDSQAAPISETQEIRERIQALEARLTALEKKCAPPIALAKGAVKNHQKAPLVRFESSFNGHQEILWKESSPTARSRVWTDHQGTHSWAEAEQICRWMSARLPTLLDFLELEEKGLVTGLDNEEYSFWISETGRKILPGVSSKASLARSLKTNRPVHWSFSTRKEDRMKSWKNRISKNESKYETVASVRCVMDAN